MAFMKTLFTIFAKTTLLLLAIASTIPMEAQDFQEDGAVRLNSRQKPLMAFSQVEFLLDTDEDGYRETTVRESFPDLKVFVSSHTRISYTERSDRTDRDLGHLSYIYWFHDRENSQKGVGYVLRLTNIWLDESEIPAESPFDYLESLSSAVDFELYQIGMESEDYVEGNKPLLSGELTLATLAGVFETMNRDITLPKSLTVHSLRP